MNRILPASCQAVLYLILLSSSSFLYGQPPVKIQLLDKSTQLPIEGATYQYADQKGLSDQEGFIGVHYSKDEMMHLSHISYGSWSLSDNEIKKVMPEGIIYRDILAINIYPVSVIALHPENADIQSLNLSYHDKMDHDGGAVLNQTPAINSIRKSGSYGFDPVLRGFKYDQLNVVINGVQSATAACPNRMDPPTSQVAPNMIERVEILKGPHTLRYGNSFGGTINFIPSDPHFSEQEDIYGRISGGYDSNGDILRSEGLIGFSGKNFDLGFFGSWSQGNDYSDGEGKTVPSAFMRGSLGSSLGLRINEKQELIFSVTRNFARDAIFAALPMDLRKDDTWLLNANHAYNPDKKYLKTWNTSVYGTVVDHLMDNQLKEMNPRMVNATTSANTYSYGGRTEGIWQPGRGKLFTGADIKVEEAEGVRERELLMGPNQGTIMTDNAWQKGRIQKSSIFAEYHLGMQHGFKFLFSGRLELNHSRVLDAQEEFTSIYPETTSTQINPSLSIGSIKQFRSFSIGLWMGRAQRSGSLTERFINYFPVGQDPYEMLGNPSLKQEKNNQADLTFEFTSSVTHLDIDLFVCLLQDYISSRIDTSLSPRLPGSPGVRQYNNMDRAFKTGFEINWNQHLLIGLQHHLDIAYTFGQDLGNHDPLPEIAPLDIRFSIFGLYLNNTLRPELSLRYVAQQNRVSNEYGETASPSFFTMDLSIAYTFFKIFSITAGVQNIFNEAYYEHLNRSVQGTSPLPLYAPGRNIFLSFSMSLM